MLGFERFEPLDISRIPEPVVSLWSALLEQRRVVEFAAVDENVRIGVARHLEGPLSHERADLRPSPPLPVEEADSAVAEVMRRPQ